MAAEQRLRSPAGRPGNAAAFEMPDRAARAMLEPDTIEMSGRAAGRCLTQPALRGTCREAQTKGIEMPDRSARRCRTP